MKVGIIGTGYVGLIQAVGLAKLGFKIVSVDVDENKINALKAYKSPIYEPGLDDLLKEVKNNIYFTTNYDCLNEFDIIFIAVGTPQDRRGRTNKDFIHSSAISIKKYIKSNKTNPKIIVIKSTVPVGTNKEVSEILGDNFEVVSNPEFLREGKAIDDFFNPDRIVLGYSSNVTKTVKEKMKNLYKFFLDKNVSFVETNWESAELIKYASNSFLAMKISFINEMALLAEKTGANIKHIALGMGLDKRIGKAFLNAGIGYGGSCFPKDVKSLINQFEENNLEGKLVKATDEVNANQVDFFVSKIEKFYDDIKGKNFLLLGLAFKPYTDDLRESRSITLAEKLYKKQANIWAYDLVKMARNNTKQNYPYINVIDDLESFLLSKDVEKIHGVIIGTEYEEFNSLDWKTIGKKISIPVIFDGRNILDKDKMVNYGFIYKGVGI